MGIEPADHVDGRTGGWPSGLAVKLLTRGQGRPAAIIAVVVLAMFHVLLGERHWSPVRHAVFDAYQRAFPRQVKALPVVIVDVDDASLAALGQWPWPRTRLARLIEATHQLGALVVGLDIIMPEADRLSPSVFLAERPDVNPALRDALATLPSNDVILAQTLRQVPSVVGRAGLKENGGDGTQADGQTPVMVQGDTPVSHVQGYAGHLTSVPQIEAAAFGHGYLNATPDVGGIVRTMPLVVAVHGELAPTFALELLRVAAGENWYSVQASPRGVRGVQIGESFIPTDPNGRIRLYYSPPDPRRRVSALAILNGEADADLLSQKVAMIGVTGVGLTDIVATPVTPLMDGVEVQAQLMENMLYGTRLMRSFAMPWLELLVFLLAAAVLIALLPRLRPGHSVVVFLVVTAVLCTGSMVCFVQSQWLCDPSFPIVGNAAVLVVLLIARFTDVDRKRRELEATLEVARLERVRMAGELQAARDIQMGMLPDPGAIEGLPDNIEFHARLDPAEEVGGDLYDAFMLDEHHFFFIVGDVTGKGVPASLFMALSKTICKSVVLREHLPLDKLIGLANEEISRENPASLFVTAVAGIIDVRTGDLALCNAGHDTPILLRAQEAPYCLDTAGGPPLCVVEDFSYGFTLVQLQSDDMLVVITDGVTEAHDSHQNLYGLHRALEYLAAIHKDGCKEHRSVEAVCQGFYEDVKHFVNGASPSDDITIMAIRFTGPYASMPTT